MPRLSIRLFGLPRFWLDETPLKVERRKTLALLACLARQPEQACSRETLSALLWPDANQEQAGAYLRQALWDFNKVAGDGWFERSGPSVRLHPQADIWVDVQSFEQPLARWKAMQASGATGVAGAIGTAGTGGYTEQAIPLLEEAVKAYTADFLAGFSLRDSAAFDEWQVIESEGLRLKLGEALEALATLHRAEENFEKGILHARRWLALDELNEAAHRELMRLLEASGQRSAALRQYEACQRRLQEELGVAPEAATTQLFQQINARRAAPASREQAPGVPREAGGRVSMRAPVPVFLPAQTTTFFGREPELARIKSMLADPECRLITLVGPGGSGKTRLAIQAAGQSVGVPHRQSFPHGIYFASLASAANAQDMLAQIATTIQLELRTEYGQGLSYPSAKEQVFHFLARRSVLLVLDNLEQLSERTEPADGEPGFTLLSELLSAAPGVKLIATSRVRLNLPEEWVLEIAGLPFPGEPLPGTPASDVGVDPASFPAMRLFLKSAERISSFTPQPADLPAIAHICRLVEGMPLGVELAAAWLKMLTTEEIAAEIERNLDFLETARPGVPERHRSLRVVFDHSWQLLSPNERSVFARLSIFRGGFTREAAFAVAGASLNMLASFVDKSMLRRVSSGRFDLHELVKQYAAERLAVDPSTLAHTEARHAQYYAGWLRLKGEQLRGHEQLAAMTALRAEKQNLLRAWRWLVHNREYTLIEQSQVELILLLEMQGDYRLLYEMMDLLAGELQSSPDPHTTGMLGLALAALRRYQDDPYQPELASRVQDESLRLARQLPACPTRAYILLLDSIGPGNLSAEDNIAMLQESAEIFQASGNDWGAALAYLVMADTLVYGGQETEQARAIYEKSFAIFDHLENDWGRALCCFGLTSVAWQSGVVKSPEGAEETLGTILRSVEIYERMGNMSRLMDARHFAAQIAIAAGRPEEARQMFSANLSYATEVGDLKRSRYYTELLAKTDWKPATERQ